jgi:hypothetical protein
MDDHRSHPRAARSQALTVPSDPTPAVEAALTAPQGGARQRRGARP